MRKISDRRLDRALHHDVDAAEGLDRLVEEKDAGDESHEFRRREMREVNVKQREPHSNRGDRLDERRNRLRRAR